MMSLLQSARLSLVVLFLISLVSANSVYRNSLFKKPAAREVPGLQDVAKVIVIRQDGTSAVVVGAAEPTPTAAATPTPTPEQTSEEAPPATTEAGDDETTTASEASTPASSSPPESTPEPEKTTPPPSSTPDATTAPDPTTPPKSTAEPTASEAPSTDDAAPSSTIKTPEKTTVKTEKHTTTEGPTPTKTTPPGTSSTPPMGTITEEFVTVIVTTIGDKIMSSTKTWTSLTPTNTAVPIDTAAKSSSMTTQTRNTVIGVVVGVGGAIFLALVFLVFWKFWGRRRAARRRGLDDDALMMTTPTEKGDANPGSNLFQSTLESYHAPQRPVNASSNF